jgi:hypothetical protein
MRFTICLFLSLLVKFVSAQDLVLSPIGEGFCKPGVVGKSPSKGLLIDYTVLPNIKVYPYNNGVQDPNAQRVSSHRLSFKLKAPIIYKPNFTMLVGFAHYREEYNVSTLTNGNVSILNTIHDRSLKSSRLSLYMIKPINEKYYVAFKGDASFNGDYNGVINFDSRYLKYNIGLLFGVKSRPNIEWGAGILFRSSFVRSSVPVLPFGIYNRTFNDKWGIEAVIPVSIKARYNINSSNLILFGPEYESRTYSLDNINSGGNNAAFSEFFMKRAELKFSVTYERQLSDWVWISAQAGYSHNFNTTFTEVDFKGTLLPAVSVAPADGVFFKVGVFVSPPRSKCK